jgi:hypothetical protein
MGNKKLKEIGVMNNMVLAFEWKDESKLDENVELDTIEKEKWDVINPT